MVNIRKRKNFLIKKKDIEKEKLKLDIELLETLDKKNGTDNSTIINRMKKSLELIEWNLNKLMIGKIGKAFV